MADPADIADFERLEDEIDEALLHCSPDQQMIVEIRRCQSHLKKKLNGSAMEMPTADEPDKLLCCRMAMLRGSILTSSKLATAKRSTKLSDVARVVSFGKPVPWI